MTCVEFDTLRFGTHAQREARLAKFRELTPEFDKLRAEQNARAESDFKALSQRLNPGPA